MMKLQILWPGKTRNQAIKSLQLFYLEKINHLTDCKVIEIKDARGITEKQDEKIKDIEASRFEGQIKDDYVICLFHKGKEMSSVDFAKLLKDTAPDSSRAITFIVGGFLGLHERILKRADLCLSFSKMTFSHELSRVILLERVYRALSIIHERQYAK